VLPPLTERQWQQQVTDLAKLRGWWVYHPLLFALLDQVDGVESYVWRPADFDSVKDTLW
jgi:hypothetical protein